MSEEKETDPHELILKEVNEKLTKLALGEKPLEVGGIKPEEVRFLLTSMGLKTELPENAKRSLQKKKFRGPEQGKGPGVVVALGGGEVELGLERYNKYENWAQRMSLAGDENNPALRRDNPRIGKAKKEKTRWRGLMQALGCFISYGAGVMSEEDFVAQLNQRVLNGLWWHAEGEDTEARKPERERLEKTFGLTRNRNRASVPPGCLPEFFQVVEDIMFSDHAIDGK